MTTGKKEGAIDDVWTTISAVLFVDKVCVRNEDQTIAADCFGQDLWGGLYSFSFDCYEPIIHDFEKLKDLLQPGAVVRVKDNCISLFGGLVVAYVLPYEGDVDAFVKYVNRWLAQGKWVSNLMSDWINPEQVSSEGVDRNDADEGSQFSTSIDATRPIFDKQINPLMTFASFIYGSNNQFPVATAQAVSASFAEAYNPLWIHGEGPWGKTHLLHAICNATLSADSHAKPLLIDGVGFVYELIHTARFGDTSAFLQKCHTYDLLLFDDFEFVFNKYHAPEILFQLVCDFVDAGKQVVITSKEHPRKYRGIVERIHNRFPLKLIVDLHPLNYELKRGVLELAAKEQGHVLPEEVLDFLAENLATFDSLRYSITRLIDDFQLPCEDLCLEHAEQCLASIDC